MTTRQWVVTVSMVVSILGGAGNAGAAGSMFDQKAFKVGDALTVLIQEVASASSTVDAKASRSTDFAVRGQTQGQAVRGLGAGTTTGSDGGGQVVRSGRVTAQITVSVIDVMANGEMLVQGKQAVDLNGESQIIEVSGRVRPRDINDANSVLSSRLADARITYAGQGYIADKSQPGTLARIMNWMGL
jgi:flagellar L-ring protein precursor FlgH